MANSSHIDVLIYVGGPTSDAVWEELPKEEIEAAHRQATHIVAVDSGLNLANEVAASVGRPVSVVIGDFDSVPEELIIQARSDGADIRAFPSAKDETDFELALLHVEYLMETTRSVLEWFEKENRATVKCVSPSYGRIDHLLAITQVLTSPQFAHFKLSAWFAGATGFVVHSGQTRRIASTATHGGLVSVLPSHGSARVSITGTKWEVHNEQLVAGSSRGISNVATSDQVTVTVHEGTVLVVLPQCPLSVGE